MSWFIGNSFGGIVDSAGDSLADACGDTVMVAGHVGVKGGSFPHASHRVSRTKLSYFGTQSVIGN